MADVNVYDLLTVGELTEINPYLVDDGDSITVSDSSSIAGEYGILNDKMLLPFNESLEFNNQIIQSHDRTEQRIALRCGIPDRRFSVKIVLETSAEISKFENKIHRYLKRNWTFPLWALAESHSNTITAGDTSITLDTQYAGYRTDGYAMIWQDRDTYDIVTIASFNDTTLNLKKTPANTYSSSKYIMPCVLAVCTGLKLNWMQDKAIVDASFRLRRVSDVIDYIPDMVYDGKVVLSTAPISTNSKVDYTYDPDYAVLDAGTGLFDIVSNSDFNIVTQPYTWHCDSKQEAWELRQFFHYINGQQKGILVPTYKNDLCLSQSVGAGDTNIYVTKTNAFDDMGYNDLRTYVAFRPSGSDIIVRKITAINPVSSTVERITINESTGTAFNANDYICWVDLCRMSDSTVNIEWYQRGKCFVEIGLTRIKTYDDSIIEPYVHDEFSATDSNDFIFDLGMNVNETITVEDDETVGVA